MLSREWQGHTILIQSEQILLEATVPEASDDGGYFVVRGLGVGNRVVPAGERLPGESTLISLKSCSSTTVQAFTNNVRTII